VRLQKADNHVEPQVGSKMAEEILANPVLANEPPELESPFIKELKNIQHMDVSNMDKIITGESFDFARYSAQMQQEPSLEPSISADIDITAKMHFSRSAHHNDGDDMEDDDFDDDSINGEDNDDSSMFHSSDQDANSEVEMDLMNNNQMDNAEEDNSHGDGKTSDVHASESTEVEKDAKDDSGAVKDENKLKPIFNYKIRPVSADE
jgi:hypothetical protein